MSHTERLCLHSSSVLVLDQSFLLSNILLFLPLVTLFSFIWIHLLYTPSSFKSKVWEASLTSAPADSPPSEFPLLRKDTGGLCFPGCKCLRQSAFQHVSQYGEMLEPIFTGSLKYVHITAAKHCIEIREILKRDKNQIIF